MTAATKPCPECRGLGLIERPQLDLHHVVVSPCANCDGSGRLPMTEAELEAEGQGRLL